MRRVLAFYRFLALEDPQAECQKLQSLGDELALRGTILVAGEGVNGTVVGDVEALSRLSEHLLEHYGVKSQKWSDLQSDNSGFHRFKVRVKPEIVSFGVDGLDMSQTGEHVDARAWNTLIDDPEVIVDSDGQIKEKYWEDFEDLFTGAGNDALTGNDADNLLDAGAGNDTLATPDHFCKLDDLHGRRV